MTWRARWARAWQGPQLLGGALCAALGLRIMIGAIAEARAAKVVPSPPEQKPALLDMADQMIGEGPELPLPPPPVTAPAATAKSLRLFLSVVVGPERSDVFVNGTRLGLSPYLGDFTCKHGEDLQIEVVPAKGPLITRQAKCAGQTVLIRD